jgi:hypothetical protein
MFRTEFASLALARVLSLVALAECVPGEPRTTATGTTPSWGAYLYQQLASRHLSPFSMPCSNSALPRRICHPLPALAARQFVDGGQVWSQAPLVANRIILRNVRSSPLTVRMESSVLGLRRHCAYLPISSPVTSVRTASANGISSMFFVI